LLVVLVAACGGADPVVDASLDDAALPADARLLDVELSPDATPPDASAPDAQPEPGHGIVLVGEGDFLDTPQALLEATLSPGHLLGEPLATVGECKLYGEPADAGLSAGTITIAGANVPATLVPSGVSPSVDYEATTFLPEDFVMPGQTITVTAAGGADLPAFSGSVVVPPALAGFVSPTTIDRSAPPTITWTASTGDEMWVWIQTLDDGFGDSRLLWCRMPDSGSYAFPAAATSMIPPTHTTGIVFLFRTNFTEVTAGSATIAITSLLALSSPGFVDIVP
jgi:hypothetical protein